MVREIAELAVLAALLAGSVASNGLVLVLYRRRPTLRTFSNRFVLNLSVAHLVQTGAVLPFHLAAFAAGRWLFGTVWCRGAALAQVATTCSAVQALLLIAIDRNYAVNSPLRYATTVTRRRTEALIAGMWGLSVVVALPALVLDADFSPEWGTCVVIWERFPAYAAFLGTVAFLLPLLKVAWVYGAMFRAARNNSARARKHSLGSGDLCPHHAPSRRRSSSTTSQSSIFGEEWRAVRTGLLVVSSFMFCWLPQVYAMMMQAFTSAPQSRLLMTFVRITSYSACIINPYLYVFRNKNTRNHIFVLLGCKKYQRAPSIFQHLRNERLLRQALKNDVGGAIQKINPIVCQNSKGEWKILPGPPEDLLSVEARTSRPSLDDLPTVHSEVIANPSLIKKNWMYQDAYLGELSRINKYRARFQRNSSDSTDNSSSLDYEDVPIWVERFKNKESKTRFTGQQEDGLPKPLRRGKSFSGEEREMNVTRGMRRSSFVLTRLRDSSESTLTSSTGSSLESQQDLGTRPRLVRQHSAALCACCASDLPPLRSTQPLD